MSDGERSALLDQFDGSDGGSGGGGDGSGGGGGDGGAVLPTWLQTLPDEIRTEDFVSRVGRYDTPQALAKGLIETQDWARGRVSLPKEGDEKSRAEFYAKVRPETPDGYKIHVPEGGETGLADAFRPFAHQIGLDGFQAESLSTFLNQASADEASRVEAVGNQEIMAFQLEIGNSAYTQRTEAISNMIAASGQEAAEFLPALEKTMGAGSAMRFLSWVAEKTGELHKVDGDDIAMAMGAMTPQAARAKLDEMGKDKEFMAKARIKGSKEYRLRDHWQAQMIPR